MNIEIWKDIPNYEGLYQVSSFGRVKSLKFKKERILKAETKNKNYLKVCLRIDNKNSIKTVHQLVAIAFLNHTINKGKIVVDHIDNNKFNNCLENLQLISHRENISKDKKGTSKYTGVHWDKLNKKWMAKIQKMNKTKYLGLFNCETSAHIQYLKALRNISTQTQII